MHSSKNVVRPERFELPTFWFVASRKRRSLQIYLVCLASLTNQSPLLFLLIVVPNVVRKQKGDRPAPSRVRIQAPNSRGSGLVSIEASTYARRPKRTCRTRSGAAGGCFRFKTANCCRRDRFSSHRLRRVRKRRTIENRQSPITCNIAGYYRK